MTNHVRPFPNCPNDILREFYNLVAPLCVIRRLFADRHDGFQIDVDEAEGIATIVTQVIKSIEGLAEDLFEKGLFGEIGVIPHASTATQAANPAQPKSVDPAASFSEDQLNAVRQAVAHYLAEKTDLEPILTELQPVLTEAQNPEPVPNTRQRAAG